MASIAPLERYLRNRFELVDADLFRDRDHVASDVTFARLAGVERRTWKRWRTTGINDRSADRVAVNLGVHPSYIWSEHDPAGGSL